MVQKAQLHVLAANRRAGIIFFPVATNLFEHLRVDLKVAPLGQEVERLAIVQVVVKTRCASESRGTPSEQRGHAPTAGANDGASHPHCIVSRIAVQSKSAEQSHFSKTG